MAISKPLKIQLQKLIGRQVMHRGTSCTVVELLEHEPALVLEASQARSSLQDNQYGNPGRRVAEVYTIPLYDEDGESRFHPELLRLGLLSSD
ncbi:MAG TPA: hypothetical protein VIQ22_01390 [Gammaproteobacteria bacterium]